MNTKLIGYNLDDISQILELLDLTNEVLIMHQKRTVIVSN